MKSPYKVLTAFKVKTPQGEREIQPGQIISLSEEQAEQLSGKVQQVYQAKDGTFIPFQIIPCYALNDCYLLVDTDTEAQRMRDSGVLDVVFSRREIDAVRYLPDDSFKAHFLAKKAFSMSTITGRAER